MRTIEVVYKAGFVLGFLSLLVFLLGHMGLLFPAYIAASVILALAAFILTFRGSFQEGPDRPYSAVDKLLLALSAGVVLVILPLALTPPTVRDELIQHLAVPKLYLLKHGIFEIPFMTFSYLPQNIDLLYAIPLAFGSDTAPRLMHLGFTLLTGLLIYFYIEREAGRTYALLGFLLYLSTPLVLNLSRTAYVDNGAAFYSTLAVFAAINCRERNSDRWLVFSAVSMGFALGAKYNNLVTLLLVNLFVVYIYSKKTGRALSGIKAGAAFLLIALLVLSPWLVRNYVWNGNPFFPIYQVPDLGAAKGAGAIAAGKFHATEKLTPIAKRYILYGESTLDIILLPFRVFWEGADNSIEKFDGVLNPVFLLFLPFAFVRRSRANGWLGAFCLLFAVMAALTVDLVTRYLMPAIPSLVILVTFGVKNLFETKGLRGVSAALLVILFSFNIYYAWGLYAKYRPVVYLVGNESREEYIANSLGDYATIRYANESLPATSKVLLLFAGDRGYYWEREYLFYDRLGDVLKVMVKKSPDEEALFKKLTAQGTTHLFINDRLFEKFVNDNFSPDELNMLAGFFTGHTIRLYGSNGFSLYELR